jgi:uncharacterized repeat protein (TIGR03806 family)
MKRKYFYLIVFSILLSACSKGKEEEYVPIVPLPFQINLNAVPYQKLSDYHFFKGDLKTLIPTDTVLPYKPASELFADYAYKKRFIWMPKNVKATYDGDDNVLNFPIGTFLIKAFYYDHVLPSNTTRLIETRLLVKKADGWKFYDYIWNEEQTEAILDSDGQGKNVPVTWLENNIEKSVNYKIPAQTECATCHKLNPTGTKELAVPIGPKPQNLNYDFNYGSTQMNQLEKWIAMGFLESAIPDKAAIKSMVDWTDASKSLELRARSYIDINCAHCHRLGAHCDYVPQRFNFSNTDLGTFGICLTPSAQLGNNPFIINAGNADQSMLVYRMASTAESEMMPIIGRRLVHTEGVKLLRDYINSLPKSCR